MRRLFSPPTLYLAPPNDSPYAAPAPQAPAPHAPAPAPPDPGPGQPVAPPAPTASPGPPNSGPPAPADLSGLQGALESALGPIRNELEALRAENAELRSSSAPRAFEPPSENDFTQELLTDPRAAVTNVVKEVVGSLSPFLNEISGTAHEAILEGHRNVIDSEFGADAFKQEFMPVLSKRIDIARKENPTLLASREWIASEINGIKGLKMNELVDRRSKAATTRTETERAEAERLLSHLNTTNLTGGLRSGAERPREPTAAEAEYLASRAKDGLPMELETLRKSLDSGNTVTALRTAFAPKEGA